MKQPWTSHWATLTAPPYYASIMAQSLAKPRVTPATPLSTLWSESQWYQHKALAPSTRRTYSSGVRRYMEFCHNHRQAPFPPREPTIACYLTEVAKSITWKSARVYLSALRMFFIEHGYSNPFHKFTILKLIQRGIQRTQGQRSVRPRQPISAAILRKIRKALQKSDIPPPDSTMLWAAFTMAYFGFLRASEQTTPKNFYAELHLSGQDVKVRTHHATITIKGSKTDQLRQGHKVRLSATGASICPVRALQAYQGTPQFHRSRRRPSFRHASGIPLTRQAMSTHLRSLLKAAGLPAVLYNTHSFRIGAATAAAKAGIPAWSIKRLGRWKSSSFETYIHSRLSRLSHASARSLARTPQRHRH